MGANLISLLTALLGEKWNEELLKPLVTVSDFVFFLFLLDFISLVTNPRKSNETVLTMGSLNSMIQLTKNQVSL